VIALLRRDLGSHVGADVRLLGAGLDHPAFLLDGELVVRTGFPLEGAARREADLLEVLAKRGLPVPEVVMVQDLARVLVHRFVPGRPVYEHDAPDLDRIGAQLADVLVEVHALTEWSLPLVGTYVEPPAAEWADTARAWARVAPHVQEPEASLVRAFLAEPSLREATVLPEASATRLCHGDLGAEHVLVGDDGATIVGIIDWSDAVVADPARDLGRLRRDLGPAATSVVRARVRAAGTVVDEHRERLYAGLAAIEDIVYGLEEGPRGYADRALANLDRTLQPIA
jgi:aminoglycoside phosphotransferase (APT) family kinase protein